MEGGTGVLAGGVDPCFYCTYDGRRRPGYLAWEGVQPAQQQGGRIGLLLDLDQGSMTIWKNDVKLGVMQAEGLIGPLCWAVSLSGPGYSARIESAPTPAESTHTCPRSYRGFNY